MKYREIAPYLSIRKWNPTEKFWTYFYARCSQKDIPLLSQKLPDN